MFSKMLGVWFKKNNNTRQEGWPSAFPTSRPTIKSKHS